MTKVVFASLFAHKRRLFGMFVSVFLGVAFLAGTLVMGDTLDKNFTIALHRSERGHRRRRAPRQRHHTDYESQRGVIDASIADEIAGSTAWPRSARRSRATGRSAARTVTRSAATVRRRSRAAGSRIPSSTRTASPKGRAPRPPTRS